MTDFSEHELTTDVVEAEDSRKGLFLLVSFLLYLHFNVASVSMICYSGSNTEHYRFKHTKTKVGKSMSPFSVRLMQAVLAIAAAAMVGGSAKQTDQPEEPVKQPQPVAEQVRQPDEVSQQQVPILDRQKSECSAPKNGEPTAGLLARLVKEVQPQLSVQQVKALTDPGGPLFVDVEAKIETKNSQEGSEATLNVADTICVIRSVNDDTEVVWRVHFQGYAPRTASR